MTSPFRLTPPRRTQGDWLHRPRLLNVVAGRFQRRLTVVRGGAGFGKTTLLLQALAHNEAEPDGVDCWLGLSPRDARPSELAVALRAAVKARASGDVVDAVVEAIWSQSPNEIALILDDVHHIEPDTEASRLLTRLLRELPNNGHLVLVGRRPPPVPTTRLLASGEALEIDEEHLAFTRTEQASFLAMRGAAELTDHRAGWPALVELTATVGAGKVESYLWEEILGGLSPERREGLARLAPLDWIDADRIEAFTGTAVEADVFLADLPLTSLEPNGAARLHALWEPVLKSIDPKWTEPEFQRALDHLAAGGHYREAIELCLVSDREAQITPLLKHLIRNDWESMAPEALETLLATLPREIVVSAPGEMMKGLIALHTDPMRAEPFIQSAQARFREEGDEESAYVSLAALSYLAFFRVDAEGLEEVARQADACGTEKGRTGAQSVRATVALVECRPQEALRLMDEARRRGAASALGMADAVVAAMALMDMGQPERALDEIQAAIPSASAFILPALWGLQFDAMWIAGQLGPQELAALDGGIPEEAGGHAHNRAVSHSILGYQNACLGRNAAAHRNLDAAALLLERGLGDRAEMAYATGRMAIAACEGNEAEGGRVIEEMFAAHDPATLAHRHTLRGSALTAVVSEKLREQVFAFADRGPCWALALDAARALIAFRERGAIEGAARLPWDAHRRYAVALVPPMVLELAVIASAQGDEHALSVAEELAVDHRGVLRRLATAGEARVADQAQALLRSMPERPASRFELRVLGALALLRDGVVVDDPTLRRERVRALLQYLAAHGEVRRDELCAEIWPELKPSAAANNLRVTLNHIRNLLEPDRDAGAPSFFLPLAGDVVALGFGDGLDLDAHLFDGKIREAALADRSGDPGLALERYEEAIAYHRGEYLADAPNSAWGDEHRAGLHARLVGALLRVAELRLGRNDLDRAVADTQRALAVAPTHEAVLRTHILARERRDGHSAAKRALESALRPLEEGGGMPDPETCRLASRFGIRIRSREPRAGVEGRPIAFGLSSRELEVLRLVDRGLSNGEIAKKLFVASSTVKTHLENVYDKLGVRRRTQAVSMAREQGLLS